MAGDATASGTSGKRGRKELRSIRRTSGKRGNHESGAGERTSSRSSRKRSAHSDNSQGDSIVDTVGSTSQEDTGVVDNEVERDKVYSSLLTILKAEHPEYRATKKRAIKRSKSAEPDNTAEEGTSQVQNDGHSGRVREVVEDDVQEQISSALSTDAPAGENEDNEERGSNFEHNQEEQKEEEEEDEEVQEEEEEGDVSQDPFELHFNRQSEAFTQELNTAFSEHRVKYQTKRNPISETEFTLLSKPTIDKDTDTSSTDVTLPDAKSFKLGSILKQRLRIHNGIEPETMADSLTALQQQLVVPMFNYVDLLYEYDSYGKHENEYRELYALHILNHVYKTRDRIIKNNQRLQNNPDGEYLDQGFTRPKVLIIAPTRSSAYEIVNTIIEKSGIEQVDKKAKFHDQFFDPALPPPYKPKSFQQLFKGNTNDFFVLGMKFTRKAIRLYSNFYQSDVIICSPLGLHMIVESTDKKKRQDDFLSSIEITIVDQLHSIEFQNTSHLYTIFDHLNKIPLEQHDVDFSRVRMWYINDQSRLFRQTMLFTRYNSPIANSILNGKCQNFAGRWKNHHVITQEASAIARLGLKVRQIFHRFNTASNLSIVDEPDSRFKFFTSVIIPSITKSTGYEDGILIYVPDYTDYVRVRNYIKEKTSLLFGDINEYSSKSQLSANRALFQQGRIKLLLYTERLHHFRRFEIKGVKSIIFYEPPRNPEFYSEVVRFIGRTIFAGDADPNISTVRCLYSKLDALSLERVVGTKRAGILIHAQNETYEFK